jgi:hypothetical protein
MIALRAQCANGATRGTYGEGQRDGDGYNDDGRDDQRDCIRNGERGTIRTPAGPTRDLFFTRFLLRLLPNPRYAHHFRALRAVGACAHF